MQSVGQVLDPLDIHLSPASDFRDELEEWLLRGHRHTPAPRNGYSGKKVQVGN